MKNQKAESTYSEIVVCFRIVDYLTNIKFNPLETIPDLIRIKEECIKPQSYLLDTIAENIRGFTL